MSGALASRVRTARRVALVAVFVVVACGKTSGNTDDDATPSAGSAFDSAGSIGTPGGSRAVASAGSPARGGSSSTPDSSIAGESSPSHTAGAPALAAGGEQAEVGGTAALGGTRAAGGAGTIAGASNSGGAGDLDCTAFNEGWLANDCPGSSGGAAPTCQESCSQVCEGLCEPDPRCTNCTDSGFCALCRQKAIICAARCARLHAACASACANRPDPCQDLLMAYPGCASSTQ